MLSFIYSFLIFLCLTFSSGYSQTIQPELEVTEENYEKLVLGAVEKKWPDVDTMLSKLLIGSGNGRQNKAIKAIHLLNNYNKTQTNQSAESTPPEIIQARLLLNEERENINKHKAVFPQQQLDKYLASFPILKLYAGAEKEKMSNVLRKALTNQTNQNNNKWPDKNQLDIAKQFFWNLRSTHKDEYIANEKYIDEMLLELIFNSKIHGNWGNFLEFSEPYLVGIEVRDQPEKRRELFSVYQAFPQETDRTTFMKFSEPYLVRVNAKAKLEIMKRLIPIYLAFPRAEIAEFISFCEPYLVGLDAWNKPRSMKKLLPIYLAFPREEMAAFISFCETYFEGVEAKAKPEIMEELFSIYRVFPQETVRAAFIKFCEPYLVKVEYKSQVMEELLPIYLDYPQETVRAAFISFCETYLVGIDADEKPKKMKALFSIYRAFPTEPERKMFIRFCANVNVKAKPEIMEKLLPIYLALPRAEIAAFISFCETYLVDLHALGKPGMMELLLPIYLSNERTDFEEFAKPHKERKIPVVIEKLISSYLSRNYLKYMRADGALKAESHPHDSSRVHSMYQETNLASPLPIIFAQDPFLPQARVAIGERFANAHDFDAVYELDRPILWSETLGYNASTSHTPRTIYNNHEIKTDYHTNEAVESFISYLDTTIATGPDIQISREVRLPGTKVVSIIKQMLGLEPKSGATRGGFAPYLSSSMYYAKPDAPLGDEMLGRTWSYMNSLPGDKEDYKKSVVLALLEAAEVSQTSIDTHCQTRITGELMKLVAFILPSSHLRPLIAGTELLPVQSARDIEARITAAPIRAQELFKNMKREDSGARRRLLDRSYATTGEEPPLWQHYEAYYDDLYRRTKNDNGIGYRSDENILTRDKWGNLVRTLNRGTAQERTEIVYYQSEFQVFEKTFTELMRKEFEEQRGLKY